MPAKMEFWLSTGEIFKYHSRRTMDEVKNLSHFHSNDLAILQKG